MKIPFKNVTKRGGKLFLFCFVCSNPVCFSLMMGNPTHDIRFRHMGQKPFKIDRLKNDDNYFLGETFDLSLFLHVSDLIQKHLGSSLDIERRRSQFPESV